ncbi:hypothetical protein D8674_013058 [Pyrus ussuriensis x Pyrus communis]|uniref:Uncharacterized protein n=1 Tax=Pyrus ussuriensis x Pyrus communis TaxID=2448454 RepID=A0A5N5GNR6_9ROSA|nr:hypothetical protein D8674_013058 [Pyrus ussuriensis x Pyrus communis]
MAKQELEKEEKNNGTRKRPNKKEVIITVYVETPSPSDSSHQKTDDHVKKIKPKPSSQNPHQTAKTRIHDRRARLLAYSQELRTTGDSQKVQWPKSGSKPKPRVENKRFTTPMRLRRTQSRWRFQRLAPEVDLYCNPKPITGRNKKSAESETSCNFLRKLRCVLRGISGWSCNKGSKVAERNYHVV